MDSCKPELPDTKLVQADLFFSKLFSLTTLMVALYFKYLFIKKLDASLSFLPFLPLFASFPPPFGFVPLKC